jgi:hypothetical protein
MSFTGVMVLMVMFSRLDSASCLCCNKRIRSPLTEITPILPVPRQRMVVHHGFILPQTSLRKTSERPALVHAIYVESLLNSHVTHNDVFKGRCPISHQTAIVLERLTSLHVLHESSMALTGRHHLS